jgi:NAD(P)-dependent dehydrogenase (short-subunit alcohol dehydrogenase family)
MSSRFDGKVALVTGGTTGMGQAVAQQLAAEGASVVINARRENLGKEVVDEITGKGGRAVFVSGDVTVEADHERMVQTAIDEFGGLHLAFNNAGGLNTMGPVQDLDVKGWDLDVTLGLTSVFFGLKYQIPAIIAAGGGAVVNNASNLGAVGMATLSPYVAAKHGVVGLTKAVALETAKQGVRVNALLTGAVDTPLLRATTGATQEGLDMLAGFHPLGRIAQPAEIAAFTSFLLSDEASFITGAALPIDGGFTAQ